MLGHALGGKHAIWWQQVEAFSAEHTLIDRVQRGFGNSKMTTGEVANATSSLRQIR